MTVEELGLLAGAASGILRSATTETKNAALLAMADSIMARKEVILRANQQDLEAAAASAIPMVMQDRLLLNETRLEAVCAALRHIANLPDPIGAYDRSVKRPNGLLIGMRRVPLGLVGIIFESRPNVTVDAAALCIKSGNACLLRGGKEAIFTNIALTKAMQAGLAEIGLPGACVSLVEDTSRQSSIDMMNLKGILDVLIPRGGKGLIRAVVDNARVPVIETGAGNCHIYVDSTADQDMATSILVNAKCQRPSVCNACETLLVAQDIAEEFLPKAAMALKASGHSVELRGCKRTCAILSTAHQARDEDWGMEYNDYILAIRVVDDVHHAVSHINRHSTHHSEAIITRDLVAADEFIKGVDSAAVYINASTRFTDGEEFGFGGEIGISTQKLHARGPMGLEHLTTIQYVVQGSGQCRE